MLLSTFFEYLSQGELSQFSTGTDDCGEISTKSYPKIITHINLGLNKLHTLLPLRLEQLMLQCDPFTHDYLLESAFARSNNPNGFILDSTGRPFTDNLLMVDEVITESGEPRPINKVNSPESVFTPTYNLLQVPNAKLERLAVMYRASHRAIPHSKKLDLTTIMLEIPNTLIEPLLSYVHARMLMAQGSAEGIQEGLLLMQKFNQSIDDIKYTGLIQQDDYYTDTFRSNGWV